jgi:hypothetical protein
VCSVGDSPTGAKVRNPVAWIAGRKETELLKPIDKAIVKDGEQVTGPAMQINPLLASKLLDLKADPRSFGQRQH